MTRPFPWVPKIFDLVTLTLKFDLLLKKNFNLGHSFLTKKKVGLSYYICTFLVKRPFHGYQNFLTLWTLTLTFDLLLKNFNLGHNFLTRRGRAFIFYIYIPCDKTFPMGTKNFLTLLPWPWSLTYFKKKNFNLGHSFLTKRGRAFILHMYIPCDKTFPWVPKFLTLWPWPWHLTYF